MGREQGMAGLEALGLSEGESRVYVSLVAASGGSAKDIAPAAGVRARQAELLLAALDGKGLATRSVADDQRFVPVPPEHAIDSLILRREQQLSQARLDAIRFLEQVAVQTAMRPERDFLQMVVGAEAAGERFQQMVLSATNEILAFNAKAMSGLNDEWTKAKIALLESGVRGRVIYDLASLEKPGVADFIRRVAFAEVARTVPTLPLSLVIVDRRAAFLPLTGDAPGPGTEVFVIYESSLLDLLLLTFEAVWERAAPFDIATGKPDAHAAGEELFEDERTILSLLGAGMKEAAVARHLGVSPRTVERRLSAITERLGTTTRFHTGVEAHRRGWITD